MAPNFLDGEGKQSIDSRSFVKTKQNKLKHICVQTHPHQNATKISAQKILKLARVKIFNFIGKKNNLNNYGFLIKNYRRQKEVTQYVKITEKHLQPRILYPAKLLHRNEGEIKTSSDEG